MNPKLRRRFIDSIDYLRRMGFFEDYSNLSSEEILEKIFSGSINYSINYSIRWIDAEKSEEFLEKARKDRERGETWGQLLKKSLEERKEYWMKASDFKVDLRLSFFDTKRVFIERAETNVGEGMGMALMKKLAKISRGVFNPIDAREEWSEWRGEPPPEVKKYFYRSYRHWSKCGVFFKFRDEEHAADFYCGGDWLLAELAVKKINELIKDTGYQYYRLRDSDDIVYTVLSENEAEKQKERGWKLSLP
ncbi:MAG: hypothetical protein FGF51_07625 [Candidatus Brockarchaeota archaeon]|nr:hypothetical protein [Candidatus Brockarchaeota archaeon]